MIPVFVRKCRGTAPAELSELALKLATTIDANALIEFARKVSDPRIYGPPLDSAHATEEITNNRFYFIQIGSQIV